MSFVVALVGFGVELAALLVLVEVFSHLLVVGTLYIEILKKYYILLGGKYRLYAVEIFLATLYSAGAKLLFHFLLFLRRESLDIFLIFSLNVGTGILVKLGELSLLLLREGYPFEAFEAVGIFLAVAILPLFAARLVAVLRILAVLRIYAILRVLALPLVTILGLAVGLCAVCSGLADSGSLIIVVLVVLAVVCCHHRHSCSRKDSERKKYFLHIV